MSVEHDRACTLAIGDEIVLGQKDDTNTPWIAQRLAAIGVMRTEHACVPDERGVIASAITRLSCAAPLLLVVGGLGPTADDLTRVALADALGETLVEDPEAVKWLTRLFRARGRTLSSAVRGQALRPSSGRAISNALGTAPGVFATLPADDAIGRERACDVFLLPGPPNELHAMFESQVAPRLRPPAKESISTRVVHVFGVPESEAAQMLGDLLDRERNPMIGITASRASLSLRIRHRGRRAAAQAELDEAEAQIRQAMGPYVYGVGETTLASSTLGALVERRQRLVVVESCTGGMLGSTLSQTSGSSEAFLGGWITYSNDMKSAEVAVPRALIERHGAVSEPVARAMAEGGLIGADADHALAVTGIAGPGGGTPEKPVGTVYIARASRVGSKVNTEVRGFRFTGDREAVRERSVAMAMGVLRLHLAAAVDVRLMGEQSCVRDAHIAE